MLPDRMARNQETQILETKERTRRHCSALGVWIEESSNVRQTSVAVPLVLPSRAGLACKTRPSRAGQSCLAVIRDASSDWKQDSLLSVVRNQDWRELPTETARLQKTRTTGLMEEVDEEAVEEVVADADVVEAGEVVVIQLGLLARVILRLLDNEKRHVAPTAGKEGPERWLELASLVRYWKSVAVTARKGRMMPSCTNQKRTARPLKRLLESNLPTCSTL
jgi:hypothetical protein